MKGNQEIMYFYSINKKVMKNLKYLVLCLLIFSSIYSCQEEEVRYIKPYIMAGEKNVKGIVYYDFDPDYQFQFNPPQSTSEYFIDLNSDSYSDFKIVFFGSESPGQGNFSNKIIPLNNSEIAVLGSNVSWADTIRFNGKIDAGLLWSDSSVLIYSYSYNDTLGENHQGVWKDASNKYLGLKVVNNDGELFGWLRLEISDGTDLILMEHAGIVPLFVEM